MLEYRPIEDYLSRLNVRLEHGDIATLAQNLGMSRNTVKKYLGRGNATSLDLQTLDRILRALASKYPALDPAEFINQALVWSSLRTRLQSTTVTVYRGAIVDAGSTHEVFLSPSDRAIVDALRAAAPGTELIEREVPIDRRATGDQPVSRTNIEAVQNLFSDRARRAADTHTTEVFIGSPKINLATELYLATLFGVPPFEANPAGRLPFGFVPRPGDTKTSCCVVDAPALKPGLVWRDAAGAWQPLGFDESDGVRRDAGIVVQTFDAETDKLDMVVFGFSGFGTRHLEMAFDVIPWPPQTAYGSLLIDVYAAQFERSDEAVVLLGVDSLPAELLLEYLPPPG